MLVHAKLTARDVPTLPDILRAGEEPVLEDVHPSGHGLEDWQLHCGLSTENGFDGWLEPARVGHELLGGTVYNWREGGGERGEREEWYTSESLK